MKTFLLLVVLGLIVYFGYRRATDYGLPWEDHIVLTSYEHALRYGSGSEEFYVHGMVKNQTRKHVEAEIECKTLPEGMTITPKSRTSVTLGPEEEAPFDMTLRSNLTVTGAKCRVLQWDTEGGAEIRAWNWVRSQWNRFVSLF